jgi:hypothetical protein
MKLQELKEAIFKELLLDNSQQLKKQHPDLVKGLDLRKKASWEQIAQNLNQQNDLDFQQTIALALEANQKSNQIVAESLNQWEAFKSQMLAEVKAEASGKLAHISDYQNLKKSKGKKSTKPNKNNVVQLG